MFIGEFIVAGIIACIYGLLHVNWILKLMLLKCFVIFNIIALSCFILGLILPNER